ncbi:MAG: hypothetical protein V3V55_01795, partial [Rhodospirillales bacterium]
MSDSWWKFVFGVAPDPDGSQSSAGHFCRHLGNGKFATCAAAAFWSPLAVGETCYDDFVASQNPCSFMNDYV